MFAIIILIQVAVALVIEQTAGGGRGCVLGMVLMALTPTFLRAGGAKFRPLDPETLVPLAYFLSSGYAPTSHLLISPELSLSVREVDALYVAFVGAIACALVTTIWSRSTDRTAEDEPDRTEIGVTLVDVAAIMTGIAGLGLVGAYIASVGIGALLKMSYGETYRAEDGLGVLVAGWPVTQFAIVYLSTRCLTIRREGAKIPRVLLWTLLLFVLCYTFNTILGRRGPLVWLLISIAISAHASKFILPRRWAALAIVSIVLYAFAIEGARTRQGEDLTLQVAGARREFERLDNPLIIPDTEGVWNNLVTIVAFNPPILEYPGESVALAAMNMIPKPIWKDRPHGLSERYAAWVDPAYARAGGGYAFSAAAEGYVNGGPLGAGLEVGLLAALFFGPVAAAVRGRRSLHLQTLAACITSNAYFMFRAEIAAIVKIVFVFVSAMVLTMVITGVLDAVLQRIQPRRAERPIGHAH